jgi:hypothetical protein
MKSELPFVPFLALGCTVALFTDVSPLAFGAWIADMVWFTPELASYDFTPYPVE